LSLCVAFASCAAPEPENNTSQEDVAATVAAITSDSAVAEQDSVPTDTALSTPPAVTSEPGVQDTQTTDTSIKSDSDKKDKDKKDSDTSKDKKEKSADKDKKKETPKADADKSKDKETPKADDKPTPKPADEKITVSVSVDCLTLYAEDPDMAGQVSNKGVILAKKDVALSANATVYDVLKASGISFSGKQYISSINGLSEFDAGPESGWVFLVNGVYSGVGVTVYSVKAGDAVQFRYTLNGGSDVK